MQVITEAIPAHRGIKKLRSVLGRAGTQTVQAQGIFIVLTVFAVLTTGIHLTEHQFPVIALFPFVIVHGTAAAKVLHLDAQVFVTGDDDGITMTLSSLIDGIGQNLKHRMLTALQIIGTKDNRRTLTHPLLPFEHGDTGIAILFLLFCCHFHYLPKLPNNIQ